MSKDMESSFYGCVSHKKVDVVCAGKKPQACGILLVTQEYLGVPTFLVFLHKVYIKIFNLSHAAAIFSNQFRNAMKYSHACTSGSLIGHFFL